MIINVFLFTSNNKRPNHVSNLNMLLLVLALLHCLGKVCPNTSENRSFAYSYFVIIYCKDNLVTLYFTVSLLNILYQML